jgi:hypothetical protein
MSKSILELDKEYREVEGELVTKLERFCKWLVGLPQRHGLELEYRKWDLGYVEDYSSHYMYKDVLNVVFRDTDIHEGCNSLSYIGVPVEWVDAYYNGGVDSVESKALKAYKEYNRDHIESDRNSVLARAIELGLIKE